MPPRRLHPAVCARPRSCSNLSLLTNYPLTLQHLTRAELAQWLYEARMMKIFVRFFLHGSCIIILHHSAEWGVRLHTEGARPDAPLVAHLDRLRIRLFRYKIFKCAFLFKRPAGVQLHDHVLQGGAALKDSLPYFALHIGTVPYDTLS